MKSKNLVLAAIFCALLCMLAPLSIPTPAVPISFATLIIYIMSTALPTCLSVTSVFVYILLGAVGLPVFSSFGGGISALISPLGGFIVGYIPCTFVISKLSSHTKNYVAMMCGTVVLYLIGTAFFSVFTKAPIAYCLLTCVLPFLPGDSLKIILASKMSERLKNQLEGLSS